MFFVSIGWLIRSLRAARPKCSSSASAITDSMSLVSCFGSFFDMPHPMNSAKMGIGRGLGSPLFQRIGAQARPIVKLNDLDGTSVERVG